MNWPWVEGVAIPYLALFALSAVEGRGGWDTLARKFIELGIDACILGIGVSGALFASPLVAARMEGHATTIAICILLVDLAITGFCLHLRKGKPEKENARARVCMFFGVLILGINSVIVRGL